MLLSFLTASLCAFAAASSPSYRARPYTQHARRQADAGGGSDSMTVDLGYEKYQGFRNESQNLDIYYGIRYAKAPTGNLRWQAPRAPESNRNSTIDASSYPAQCPQSAAGVGRIREVNNTASSEDCLFLNVWSPSDASEALPVYVWIHGGGYGTGSGQQDQTPLLYTNNNSFVAVTIQYRLGAFGFLASDEVARRGALNAGLLDQQMALQWVQQYIHLFNGDASRVTIAGESAGAGSVMLLGMAYGGSMGTELFTNSIAASPYLPFQYHYKDWVPSQLYYAFASYVGCAPTYPVGHIGGQDIFDCLLSVDTDTLMNASATVNQQGGYGTYLFTPVTDGVFIQGLPSRQFGRKAINGANMLVGNNANEGASFTQPDIETIDDLVEYLAGKFPLFSNNDIAKLLYYYPTSNATTNDSATLFATTGDSPPYALNQSAQATGQQQRAELIISEFQFVCPAYWMAEAYSDNDLGGNSWKYQFSIPPAYHGTDLAGYYDYPGEGFSVDFSVAFQKIFGNFIVNSNPSISNVVANGITGWYTNGTQDNPASDWPPYSIYAPNQLDLNTTCPSGDSDTCGGPDAVNTFRLTNAYTWEAGRGERCDFWRAMGERVPE
ncbi:hypothetical protein D0865_02350 [Hortaea werneckii]|uniref:Carboxylesterase type B domain-containing protein n=1 Tax=Hortaea werneckii TaxID=91943 RepID=A0A3M7D401_HORWE|nr:hypothetical protein D0865_02350 [Hortaea werneckii]